MIKSTINNLDPEAEPLQQMRNYEVVSIRRTNREQHFQKKRIINPLDTRSITSIAFDPVLRAEEIYQEHFQPSNLEELIQNIESDEPHLWLRSAVGLRKLSCLDCELGTKTFKQKHIFPITVLAQIQEYPPIIAEGLWCLCNIISAQHLDDNFLMQTGIPDFLLKIIKRSSQFGSDIYKHTLILLGNLAIDSPKIRDYLLQHNCIQSMVENLCTNPEMQLDILNGTLWTFSNLMRSHSLPPYDYVQPAVRYISCVIVEGIQNLLNNNLISDCLFVLNKYVHSRNGNLQEMKDRGLIPVLIKTAKEHTARSVVLACLRVLGNFSTENWQFMLQMIEEGLIEVLQTNLYHEYTIIRRQCCWIMSNMAPNPIQVAKHIYQNPQLLNKLKKMFQTDDINTRKEICYIFSNLSYCMLVQNYFKLVIVVQLPENMVALLEFGDDNISEAVLRCLIMILRYFSNQSETYLAAFMNHFQRAHGYEQLEKLQLSKNETICDLANQLINDYCSEHFECGQVERDGNNREQQQAKNWAEDEHFYDGFEQFKQNNPL